MGGKDVGGAVVGSAGVVILGVPKTFKYYNYNSIFLVQLNIKKLSLLLRFHVICNLPQ